MLLGRRCWRLWVVVLAAGCAAAVWWWAGRVAPPEVPAPALDPAADPALVADVTAARQGVLDNPRSAAAWGEYGIVLRANEFHPEADVCFRTAAALDPSDGRWPYLLGSHLAATDPVAAVEWLRKAAAATVPEAARESVRLRLVETLLTAGRVEEARAARGDRAGAIQALRDGLRADPRDVSVNYQLGRYYFAEGEERVATSGPRAAEASFREAVKWLDAALAVDPDFGKALLLKGVALQRFLGQPGEGIALLRRFVHLRPEVAEGHLLLGQALAATD